MKRATFLTALLFSGAVYAKEKTASIDSCKAQVDLYCEIEAKTGDIRQITKCLQRHDNELSTQCKQEIQRFAQATRQTTPPSGPMGSLGGLTGAASQIPMLSYDGRIMPSSTNDKNDRLLTENNFNFSMPISKTETETYSATLVAGHFRLSDPILLSSGQETPSDFYRTEVGLGYSRRLADNKMFGMRGAIGYTGDKFTSNTQSWSLSANYAFPSSKENASWVLMLMMSNNSPLGTFIPIPGFFYIYRTPTFTGLFGLPVMSLQWTPVNPWSFSLSLLGPNIKTEAAYGAIDKT